MDFATTAPAFHSHKRPLPPPCSQNEVRECSSKIDDWLLVDNQDDLLMERHPKKPKLFNLPHVSPITVSSFVALNADTRGASISELCSEIPPVTHDKVNHTHYQRKPLFQTYSKLQGTSMIRKNEACSSNQLVKRSEPLSSMFTSNPKSILDAPTPHLPEEVLNEEDEADMLSRLTSLNSDVIQETNKTSVDRDEQLNYNRRRDEEQSRNRSRIMRQKNLASRRGNDLLTAEQSILTSTKENDLSLIADHHGTTSSLQKMTQGLPSSINQPGYHGDISHEPSKEINANLDVCQSHVDGNKTGRVEQTSRLSPFYRAAAKIDHTQDCQKNSVNNDIYTVGKDELRTRNSVERLRELTTLHKARISYRNEEFVLSPPAGPMKLPQSSLLQNEVPEYENKDGSPENYNSGFRGTSLPHSPGWLVKNSTPADLESSNLQFPTSTLSSLQQLIPKSNAREDSAMKLHSPASVTSDQDNRFQPSHALLEAWPAQGERGYAVSLPLNFDDLNPESQQATIEHERLKERKRDLTTAQTAMQGMAALWSIKPLDSKEREWMNILKLFLDKVILEDRSGKRMRDKLKGVSDSLQRRLLRQKKPKLEEVQSLFKKLFKNYFTIIEAELSCIDGKIDSIRSLRFQSKTEKNKKSKETRTKSRFDAQIHLEGHTNHRDSRKLHANKLKAKGIQSKVLPKSRGDKIAAFRSQLSQFLPAKAADRDPDSQHLWESSNQKREDEISEEDEGEEYYSGAGVTESTNIPQAADHELAESNQRHLMQCSINEEQGAQKADLSLASNNIINISLPHAVSETESASEPNASEFDDTSEDFLSAGSSDYDWICHRYLVKEEYYNIEGYEDGAQIINHRFLDASKANAKVEDLMSYFTNNYRSCDEYRSDRTIRTSVNDSADGLRDCRVQLGTNDIGGCHIWVEKEDYYPNEEAYQRAKLQRACNANHVFWVLWRKILKPFVEAGAEEISLAPQVVVAEQTGRFSSTGNNIKSVSDEQHCHEVLGTISEDDQIDGEGIYDGGLDDNDLFGPDVMPVGPPLYNVVLRNVYLEPVIPIQNSMTRTWSTAAASPAPMQITERQAATTTSRDELLAENATIAMSIAENVTSEPASNMQKYPSSPPTKVWSPSTQQQSLLQEIHFNDIQQFTTISMANRHAKNLFMQWYTSHLTSADDQAFLRHEEDHMENELKTHGNLSTWSRAEEFIVDVSNRGNARSENQKSHHEHEHRAIEKYHIWVERRAVRGPAN